MKYLITGVTGAGKSTIAQELKRRGYKAYDSDEIKNLSRWENKTGEAVKGESHPPKEWYEDNFWNWNRDRLFEVLSEPEDVFICGISSNIGEFYKTFDRIFLLLIAQEDMEHRLHTRKKNSFGRDPEALKSIISWHKSFEADAIQKGAIPVDATLTVEEIIEKILAEAKSE